MSKKQKRYNKLSLNELTKAVNSKEVIDISNQDEMKANKIILIKRDGKRELFSPKKLDRVCMYATDNNRSLADELIRDTKIKLQKEIRIQDMYEQLINTAVNKISMLFPIWETISAKLQLLSYYKETYNLKDTKSYPHLKDVFAKGIEHKIYDKNTLKKLTDDEIERLNSVIVPERDLNFTYKSLSIFFDKYCLNYTKTRKLELPQITYMRVAIALMIEEDDKVQRIIEEYNALSTHLYTRATPINMNALTPNQQLSSCVLTTLIDDSHNILDTGKNLGIYSKYKGGTALDITSMRAKGSYIEGTQGYSSGPIPFMKFFESIMKAWNQGGKRAGSLAVYFSWWHIDVFDLLSLKSNGGTEENRARGLKYALKLNQIFIDKVQSNEDIYLFDPKDTPKLIGVYGEEFNRNYNEYVAKTSIRRKKVNARELFQKFSKERSETGNIYVFHEENVNDGNMTDRYIGCSNLCTEILESSRPSEVISESLMTLEDGSKVIEKKYTAGEVALCNLTSVNLEKWYYMDEDSRWNTIRVLLRGLDNTIDVASYPVKEGKNANMMYRYMGVGVMNYTNYLALNKIVIDSKEALEETDKLFDDLSYKIISVSMELAKEKGRFEKFYETDWAKGILPIHKAKQEAINLTKYEVDMDKWNKLAEDIMRYGLRNATLMAIAPTSTSGKSINATESIEPINNFFYKEEGTSNIPTLVPNFKTNNQYYKKAFDCDQYSLMENAAVRQKWLDQSQSVNMYFLRPDSLEELMDIHLYAFYLGLKTLYYVKQPKEGDDEECESCS